MVTAISNSLHFIRKYLGKATITNRSVSDKSRYCSSSSASTDVTSSSPRSTYSALLNAEQSTLTKIEPSTFPLKKFDNNLFQEPQYTVKPVSPNPSQMSPGQVVLDADNMLFELLVSQCMIEAKHYKVLATIEEYEVLTNSYCELKNKIEETQSKLQTAKILQEVAWAYSRLTNYQDTIWTTNEPTKDSLSMELSDLEEQQADFQYQLLRHTAGILYLGILSIEASRQQQDFGIKPMLQSILKESDSNLSTLQLIDQLELKIKTVQSSIEKRYQQSAKEDLEYNNDLEILKNNVSDAEFKLNLIQSQVDWLQLREENLKAEVDDYRSEVFFLRVEQEQYKSRHLTTSCGNQNLSESGEDLGKLSDLKADFSKKEDVWIKASSNLEANLNGVLKEVQRLSDLSEEFQENKLLHEKRIAFLLRQKDHLESELMNKAEEKEETATTAAFKKEFKEIIANIQAEYQNDMARLLQEKRRLSDQLRDEKHKRALLRYDRVNQGIQTWFIP